MNRVARTALGLPLALAACATDPANDPVGVAEQEVRTEAPEATCQSLGLGGQQVTLSAPTNGTVQLDAGNQLTFRYYDESETFFYFTNSSISIDAVLVHDPAKTSVWELPGANGWPSLFGVDGAGTIVTPTAVSFCFDYELFLNPNAYAHYGRRHSWDIAKTGITESLLLAEGQSYLANYQVTVTHTGSVDEGMWIEGPVFVRNPSPYATQIDAVRVSIGELTADVSCPGGLPATVAPFSTLTCTFMTDAPDTQDRLVLVEVDSDGQLATRRSEEIASFASHTTSITDLDECVKVYDDHAPYADDFLGSVCLAEGAKTFTYQAEVGPYPVCGPFEVVNTAWFEGIDTALSDTATHTVTGEIPCEGGCTLTPGYWKTHSSYGPARADATWLTLPAGPDTTFFLSGASYYDVLHTAPQGNAYYILAHAYIAAELNQLNAANASAISADFAEATALLSANTPTGVATAGRRSTLRATAIRLGAALDAYNNGVTGPGHCTE